MNFADIAITSIETINAFALGTGSYLFTLDELQNATIAQSQETSDITGKQGRKLARLKRNKSVTISGANGMVSGGLMEMQTGGKFENKATEVMWTDYLTVTGNAATTTWKAIGTTGAEIEALYLKDENGAMLKKLEQASETSEGHFAYAPISKKLTFTSIEDGTEIVVYYKRKMTADVLENSSDNYSGKCSLYIDALAEDKCGKIYRIQFFIPKADFNGEFSMELGDNQTVHNFEAESMAGACGARDYLWTYTIFGADVADAE